MPVQLPYASQSAESDSSCNVGIAILTDGWRRSVDDWSVADVEFGSQHSQRVKTVQSARPRARTRQ